MKKIGFLTFGFWRPDPASQTRAALAAVAVALAGLAAGACALVGAPAAAASAASRIAPTPGQQIAAALRTSPLYVDPSLRSQFTPEIRASILRAIHGAPVAVFVLAVPLPSGGEWGNGDQLAAVVHAYLGRAGIYLTPDVQFSNEVDAYTWPSDPYGSDAAPYHAADAAQAVDLGAATRGDGLPGKLLSCIGLISSGQAVRAYQAALRQVGAAPQPPPTVPGWLAILLVVIAAVTAVGGAGAAAAWAAAAHGRQLRPPAWRWRVSSPGRLRRP